MPPGDRIAPATCHPCSSPQGPRADSCENTALLGLGLPRPAAFSHPIKPGSQLLTVTDGLGLVETWDSNQSSTSPLEAETTKADRQ